MSEKKTHSEKLKSLEGKIEDIKGELDTLYRCKRDGNMKQVAYWVGKISHDMVKLGSECIGEAVLEKKGSIITP